MRSVIVEAPAELREERNAPERRPAAAGVATAPAPHDVAAHLEWRSSVPVLRGALTTLRELRTEDAPLLLELLSADDVARFISPPPATLPGFERFITWAREQRVAGAHVGYAILDVNTEAPIGLIQVRRLDATFEVGEWGFALGSPYWGSGLFMDAAHQTLRFVFDTLGVHRLEARAVVENSRGNGALAKLGAVQEAVLPRSILRNGRYLDQALWTIRRRDWIRSRRASAFSVH